MSIIKHLNTSLEELDVSLTKVDSATVLGLKSIPTLKTLIYNADAVDIANLKQKLPHIRITEEEDFLIASPSYVDDLIWEIRAKQQYLFSKVWVNNEDDSDV